MSLRDAWDERADAWARFARTPGHDRYFDRNLSGFLELLPTPPARTLDLGCGEGRVGAELTARGYDVVGVDSSPRLVELARERHEALCADAAALPFEDGRFDLVVAFMSLFNMEDLDSAVAEAGRVLGPKGRLCAAVLHPLVLTGGWTEDGFLASRSYFADEIVVWRSDRDGIEMTFHDRQVTFERYSRALEAAGLIVEAVRELPSERGPMPVFLHLRAVRA